MQRSTHWAALAAIGLLAAACAGGDGADEDAEAAAEAGDTDSTDTVFDDLVETKERARGVEDLNDERRALLESAIEPPEAEPADDSADIGEAR